MKKTLFTIFLSLAMLSGVSTVYAKDYSAGSERDHKYRSKSSNRYNRGNREYNGYDYRYDRQYHRRIRREIRRNERRIRYLVRKIRQLERYTSHYRFRGYDSHRFQRELRHLKTELRDLTRRNRYLKRSYDYR